MDRGSSTHSPSNGGRRRAFGSRAPTKAAMNAACVEMSSVKAYPVSVVPEWSTYSQTSALAAIQAPRPLRIVRLSMKTSWVSVTRFLIVSTARQSPEASSGRPWNRKPCRPRFGYWAVFHVLLNSRARTDRVPLVALESESRPGFLDVEPVADDLDGDDARRIQLLRQVDLPHATGAVCSQNPVAIQIRCVVGQRTSNPIRNPVGARIGQAEELA